MDRQTSSRNRRGTGAVRLPHIGATPWAATLAILLLAPATLGTGLSTATTVTAPYTGSISATHDATNSTGCASPRVLTAPAFHPSTGVARFAIFSQAKACLNSSDSYALADGGFTLNISLALPSGRHVATLKWTLDSKIEMAFNNGTCPGSPGGVYFCYDDESIDLVSSWEIVDLNSPAVYAIVQHPWSGYSNASRSSVDCSGTTCFNFSNPGWGLFPFSTTVTSSVPMGGLNASHHYVAEITFTANLFVNFDRGASTNPGAFGTVRFDAASPGLGWTLNSIVVV